MMFYMDYNMKQRHLQANEYKRFYYIQMKPTLLHGGESMDEEKNLNVEKPSCPLIGQDGNIFNLVGIAARTLREAGLRDQAKELTHRIFSGECHSYGEALCLIGEYVTITDIGDYNHNRRGKEKDSYER